MNEELEAAIVDIEKALTLSKAWHKRNAIALQAINVIADVITRDFGNEAGDAVYRTGVETLHKLDKEDGRC